MTLLTIIAPLPTDRIALRIVVMLATALASPPRVDVHFVDDEARAVLAILDKRAAQHQVTDDDWQRLFRSEGYVRLAARERSFGIEFTDDGFRKFVLSDDLLAQRAELARIVDDWTHADLRRAADLALAYLPAKATIRARVYPAIKPRKNSFVWEVSMNPAIFLAVEPKPRDAFLRIVAHELHHIGYGTACSELPMPRPWVGAFGEGFAVLAAAGGPAADPQPDPEARQAWQRQMSTLASDFRDVERFLIAAIDGTLSNEEARKRGMEFFGTTGPWYTIGWTMATTIETTFGRAKLIEVVCDQRKLLGTYNAAVKKSGRKLPLWSPRLIELVDR